MTWRGAIRRAQFFALLVVIPAKAGLSTAVGLVIQLSPLLVIPAEAGIQLVLLLVIPACF